MRWPGGTMLCAGALLLLSACGGDDDVRFGVQAQVVSTDNGVDVSGGEAPVAVFAASTVSGTAPLTVVFDASDSSDPEGLIRAYRWDFGDGTDSESGVRVSHTFVRPGGYRVRLTVIDSNDLRDVAELTIQVTQPGPAPVVQLLPEAELAGGAIGNDRPSDAQPLSVAQPIAGAVSVPDDPADYFMLWLEAGDWALLSPADAGHDLFLYDASVPEQPALVMASSCGAAAVRAARSGYHQVEVRGAGAYELRFRAGGVSRRAETALTDR